MFRRIQDVKPLIDYRIQLTYEGHPPFVLDFTSVVRQGGVFTPMADPAFFAQVRVGEHGRFIVWPGDIDFCADALWLKAHPQEAIVTESASSTSG